MSTLSDIAGGQAERIAWRLFQEYRRQGLESFLAVGFKRSHDLQVLEIPNESSHSKWWQGWSKIETWAMRKGIRLLPRLSRWFASPSHEIRECLGWENFDFPGSQKLLGLTPKVPDLVHFHNLHGRYFDLARLTASLSQRVPVVLHHARPVASL